MNSQTSKRSQLLLDSRFTMILLILADILKLFFFQGFLVQPLLPPSFLSPTWLIYFPTTFPGGVYFATIQV